MSCKVVQNNLEAYLDDELTLSDRRDFEDHLDTCKQCQDTLEYVRALNQSIKKIGYTNPPSGLRRKIKSGLRDITGEDSVTFGWPQLLGFGGASAVLASVSVWAVMSFILMTPIQLQLTDELVTAHVRSLMVDHMTDVTSSDRHTVKPWFNGRLDFAPTVLDMSEQGYPLLGGRLEYLHNRPAAALVYKRRAHIINLFIMQPEKPAKSQLASQQQRGYQLVSWEQNGLRYTLVSDLNLGELQAFADMLATPAH